MTYYPCDVCGIERCGGCCDRCRRSDKACICAQQIADKLKEISTGDLENELVRRHKETNRQRINHKRKEIDNHEAEIDKLKAEIAEMEDGTI